MSFTTAAPRTVEVPGHSDSYRPVQATDLLMYAARYHDLADRRLAAKLMVEDRAEERDGLSPHERLTCHTHRRWVHECISSPLHVIVITGHRYCRRCEREAAVAVDELAGTVRVSCVRCHRVPDSPATRQIVRTCRASLAAAREGRNAPAAEQAARAA
jgi:hypothetical protein